MRKIIVITSITAVVLIAEWLLILGGILPLDELEPSRINVIGYRSWFMSFSVPDMWIVICCLLSCYYALKNKIKAIVFSMIAGSSMIFLALVTITFYAQNSMLFDLNYYQLFENLAVVWLLMSGAWLIYIGIQRFGSVPVEGENQKQGSPGRTVEGDSA